MRKKIRVAVLFGGRSAEHEVSLQSAHNVIKAIDKKKYEVVELYLEKSGEVGDLLKQISKVDVVFPVLHGTYGEDGTMQGLLKLANIPFVGAGVLGSAVGMDKDVMKRLLRDGGVPVGKFLVFKQPSNVIPAKAGIYNEKGMDPWFAPQEYFSLREGAARDDGIKFKKIIKELGLPFFVKPANLGSSVGVSKVHDELEFDQAIKLAFQFDSKILIEEFIKGREIECAVLGNDEKIASIPGELTISHEFYDYNAKYTDPKGAQIKIPAEISEEVRRRVQELAIRVCEILCCDCMARVDFFVTGKDEVYVNEINTIPGFTNISMYPKMWEKSGMSQTELVDRLIQLAMERFEKEKKLKTSFLVS